MRALEEYFEDGRVAGWTVAVGVTVVFGLGVGVGVVASGFADAAPSSVVETAEPHQR